MSSSRGSRGHKFRSVEEYDRDWEVARKELEMSKASPETKQEVLEVMETFKKLHHDGLADIEARKQRIQIRSLL